jgi:hypothetical protein
MKKYEYRIEKISAPAHTQRVGEKLDELGSKGWCAFHMSETKKYTLVWLRRGLR